MTADAGPYTRQRPHLTPADIRDVVFAPSSRHERSYDGNEVDDFLTEAEDTLVLLQAENRRLREGLRGGGPTKDELVVELGRLEDEAARAEQHTRELRAEVDRAREPLPPADRHADVVAMARRFADTYVSDAQREAVNLLAAARAGADELAGEAYRQASSIDSEARARHAAVINGLFEERAAALTEIGRLAGRADEVRESLRLRMAGEVPELFPPTRRGRARISAAGPPF